MEGLSAPDVPPGSSTSDSNSSTEQVENSQPANGNSKNEALSLVKNGLKSKIQKKYMESGQAPLQVSFDPPPKYELTEEEMRKQELRKIRNRKSANFSREKRKQKEESLVKEVETLETDHKKLKREIQQLAVLKEKMESTFKSHLVRCQEQRHKLQQLLGSEQLGELERDSCRNPPWQTVNGRIVGVSGMQAENTQTLSPDSPVEIEPFSRQTSEGFDANVIQDLTEDGI
ncbi:cyclic AMP-responsive element-binding protein 3-like protein 2 isoform X2 [Saccostrea echinata]|nr:cyclic AMP-responsive element-binding protein 3-like protein 2 isoform X2 [Saccostrea echinata]